MRNKQTIMALTMILGSGIAGAAQALLMDTEGATTSGANDTAATAQALGSLPGTLSLFGWIDRNDPNDLDVYSFSLAGSSPATVWFDIDFANDIITPSSDDDDGLDSVLSVFDATGSLIDANDDVGFPPDPGSGPNGDFDSFLELTLDAGDYFVAVSSFSNFSNGTLDDFQNDGSTSGQYCLEVRTGAGFDAPANPQCRELTFTETVPEPATLALLAVGIAGIGYRRRRGLMTA